MTLFTSKTPHFGNSSTSRVEGSHFRAKSFLDGRNNDLLTCFSSFKRFEEHQTSEISVLVGIERTKTLQGLPDFFQELNGVVSHFALKKLKLQYNLLSDSSIKPCTNTFSRAWGLLCSHQMAVARDHSNYLSADLIHNQWKLTMEVSPKTHEGLIIAAREKFQQLLKMPEHSLRKIFGEISNLETGQFSLVHIMNAAVKEDNRGRPQANNSQGKRKRSPEGRWKCNLEIAENAQRRRVSKCSLCSKPGHKITTCPRRQSQPEARTLDDVLEDGAYSQRSWSDSEGTRSSSGDDQSPEEDSDSESLPLLIEDSPKVDSDNKSQEDLGDICTYCDEPLPAIPSDRLKKMEATLSIMAKRTKGFNCP